MERLELTIEGMTCEHCVRAVKNRLTQTPGVEVDDVRIGHAVVRHDPTRASVAEIEDVIADEGYTAFPLVVLLYPAAAEISRLPPPSSPR